jgi:cyclase
MIATRIIPCLDVDFGQVVKGIAFKNMRHVGDPVAMAREYYRQGADELAFLDIGATFRSREILIDIVERVSRGIFIPLTVGGGLRTVEDIRRILQAGADKVSLGSASLAEPELLTAAAARFGSQCIVLSIDAKRTGESWRVYSHGGRCETTWDAIEWACCGERLGVGEILLNSIDRDGTGQGYDLELLRNVSSAVTIPVITSGGAGSLEQLPAAVFQGRASAILLASLLHDGILTISEIKNYLQKQGVICR